MEPRDRKTLQLLVNTSRVSSLRTRMVRLPRPGARQRVQCTAWAQGGLGLWFHGNRSSIFPLLRLLTRAEGGAGTVLACPGIHGPCQKQCKNPWPMAHQSLLCRPRGLTAPARIPTMPRSCWQYLGAVRWTLPRWGIQCGTFAQRSPFTGPVEQRVSCGGYGERPGLPWTVWERERIPLGFTEAPPLQGPGGSG